MSAAVYSIQQLTHYLGHFPWSTTSSCISSGLPALDEVLDGGYPRGKLIEIYPQRRGRAEIRILAKALSQFKKVVWVLSPEAALMPYRRGFQAAGFNMASQLFVSPRTAREAFWCAEQAVVSGEAQAVVAWLNPLSSKEDRHAMERLRLASSRGEVTLFAIRPFVMSGISSPAACRLQLHKTENPFVTRVRIMKETLFWSTPIDITIPSFGEGPSATTQELAPASTQQETLPALATFR